LTFRAGFLVAGVTLIQYPTDAGIDPDSAELERLATLLEQRVTAASIHGTSPGAVVVRLDPATPDLVSYDDAYYRWAGTNIPQQSGESESQEGSRLQSYRGSTDVYQLWQGVPDRSGNVMLYGVTLLRFPDEAAAGDWASNLQTILSANSFYANLTPVTLSAPLGDQRVGLTYRAGGASGPHAALVAVRVGSTVARVHLVGSGAMTSVPISALELLTSAQANCLGDPTCSHTTAWPLPLNG
jgi:hypothetical protein